MPSHTDHPHIHTAHTPEASGDAVLAVTDIREADKRLTVAASEATGSAILPRTGAAQQPGVLALLALGFVGAGTIARLLVSAGKE